MKTRLVIFAVIGMALGCGSTPDPCGPVPPIPAEELGPRIRQSYEAREKAGADLDEQLGTFDCRYKVTHPLQDPIQEAISGLSFSMKDLKACYMVWGVDGASRTSILVECLLTMFSGDIKKRVGDRLVANGFPATQLYQVGIDDLRCKPTTLKLLPDVRYLNRDVGPSVLIPVLIELLEAGAAGAFVPSPASIPLLFPGVVRRGEEACLPPEPAKRCVSTGCVERPEGAEDVGGTTTAGDVIPPGSDPGSGATGGDYYP